METSAKRNPHCTQVVLAMSILLFQCVADSIRRLLSCIISHSYTISMRYRGNIWCKMLPNKLCITPDIYQEHLEEARKLYDANGRLSLLVKPDDLDEALDLGNSDNAELLKLDDRGGDNLPSPDKQVGDSIATGEVYRTPNLTQSISKDSTASVDSFIDRPEEIGRNSMYSSEKLELLVASMTLIKRDIPRTFPTLSFFHDDGPLAASLDHVLKAYACYEPTIGYVQVRSGHVSC